MTKSWSTSYCHSGSGYGSVSGVLSHILKGSLSLEVNSDKHDMPSYFWLTIHSTWGTMQNSVVDTLVAIQHTLKIEGFGNKS